MTYQELNNMKSLGEILEEAHGPLMALSKAELLSPRVDGDLADVNTNTTLVHAEPRYYKIEETFSESVAASIRNCLDNLPSAVRVYHATDLLFENVGKEEYGEQRKELAERIQADALELYYWAWALYRNNTKISSILKGLKKGSRPRNAGEDVVIIAKILKDNWDYVEGKTILTFEYVDRASKEAGQLLALLNKIEEKGKDKKNARDLRRRAYTVWVKMYKEVRRAYRFVLWDDKDLKKMFPSVSPLRAPRKKKTEPPKGPSVEIIE